MIILKEVSLYEDILYEDISHTRETLQEEYPVGCCILTTTQVVDYISAVTA